MLSIIFSLLALSGGLISLFLKTKLDVAKLQVKLLELESRINVNAQNIEIGRTENREDHRAMFTKMDIILSSFNNK